MAQESVDSIFIYSFFNVLFINPIIKWIIIKFLFNLLLIYFSFNYFFYSKFLLNCFLQFFFIKRSNYFFTINIINTICQWCYIFHFINYKKFFRPSYFRNLFFRPLAKLFLYFDILILSPTLNLRPPSLELTLYWK